MSLEVVFDDMSYGSSIESQDDVKKWLNNHQGVLGSFVSGESKNGPDAAAIEAMNLSTDEVLTTIKHHDNGLQEAVTSADAAQRQWFKLAPAVRSRLLISLSSNILKNYKLIAKLESLSTGRLFQHVHSTIASPVVNTVQYFARWPVSLFNKKYFGKPLGVVIIKVPANSSTLVAIQKLAPALAPGNSVVLYLDGTSNPKTVNLGLFYLAELFTESGIPSGVLNVVYGLKEIWKMPHICRAVGGIAYVGTVEGGRELRQCTAGSGGFLSLFLQYKYAVMVFDTADIDSAVDATLQVMKRLCEEKSTLRVVVQESAYKRFVKILQASLSHIRLGHSLDTSADIGPVAADFAKNVADKILQIDTESPSQIRLPLIDILTFRTTKEAVGLVNDSACDVRASIWTENVNLTMEVIKNISASIVWVNCVNEYDPSVEVRNRNLSGGGLDGGKECLYQYTQPSWHTVSRHNSAFVPRPSNDLGDTEIVKMALNQAQKSLIGWKNLGHSGRAKIIYSVAIELENNFSTKEEKQEGCLVLSVLEKEFVVRELHFWASNCYLQNGKVQGTSFKGQVLTICEPKGVIGIVSSDECTFSTIITLLFSAITTGNSVVIFAKIMSSILNLLVQKLISSGLPADLITIVPEDSDLILSSIFNHDIQSVWHIGSRQTAEVLEFSAGKHFLQSTWITFEDKMAWENVDLNENKSLLCSLATSSKTVWLPAGVTFAN